MPRIQRSKTLTLTVLLAILVWPGLRPTFAETDDKSFTGTFGAPAAPAEPHFQPSIEAGQVAAFTGASTYSFPLEIPSGAGGLSMPLSLTYNSDLVNAKNTSGDSDGGWVGLGWTLDVGRVALTGGTSGDHRITLGDRSMTLRGRTPGAPVACDDSGVWTCENEVKQIFDAKAVNFWKIEKTSRTWSGNVCSSSGGQVEGRIRDDSMIQAWNTSGVRYDFGVESFTDGPFDNVANGGTGINSRLNQLKFVDGVGPDHKESWFRAWGLERMVDPHGNILEIDYTSHSSQKWEHNCSGLSQFGWKENYPSEIRYTTNPDQGDTHAEWRVAFVTSTKTPDTLADRSIAQSGVLLNSVQVWFSPTSGADELVREYVLEYDQDIAHGKESYRLARIRPYGQGGVLGGVPPLPSVEMTYTLRTVTRNGAQHDRYFLQDVSHRGGSVAWTYEDHDESNYRKQVVLTKTVDPGVGSAHSSTFAYANGALKVDTDGTHRLIGFREVTEIFPDRREVSFFDATDGDDDAPLNGKRLQLSIRTPAHVDKSVTAWSWEEDAYAPNTRVHFVRQTQVNEHLWDDGGTEHSKRREFTFDGNNTTAPLYGHVVAIKEFDSVSATAPFRSTAKIWVANTSAWIVDRLKQEAIFDGDFNKGGTLVKKTKFIHNAHHSPTLDTVDPRGLLYAQREYDFTTGVERVRDTRYAHDLFGNRTTVRVYDTWGTANTYAPGTPRSTITTYDGDHHTYPVSTVNALGHVVEQRYYGVNELSTFDGNGLPGQLKSVRDVDNGVWTEGHTYDAFGRPLHRYSTRVTGASDTDWWVPSMANTLWTYDDTERSVEQSVRTDRNINGPIHLPSWTFFDALGRTVQNHTYRGPSHKAIDNVEYDARGNVVRSTRKVLVAGWPDGTFHSAEWSAANPATTHTYDLLGRLRTTTSPDGAQEQSIYWGPWGDVAVIDPLQKRKIQQKFDTRGHNIATLEYEQQTGLIQQTDRTYDVLGRLLTIEDAQSNTITFTYDTFGNRLSEVDPDRGTSTYEYDVAGRLLEEENAMGGRVCQWYDALDRPVARQLRLSECPTNTPSGAMEYIYDVGNWSVGRLVRTETVDVTREFTYDPRGRKASESLTIAGAPQTYMTAWGYDEADRVVTMVYPDNQAVTTTYKNWGADATLTAGGSPLVTYTNYNTQGQLTKTHWGNGLLTRTSYYGAAGNYRLSSIKVGIPTNDDQFERYEYTYDLNGNVTQIRDRRGATNGSDSTYQDQNFTYDYLDRLEDAWTANHSSGAYDLTFDYDSIGNMQSVIDGGATTSFGYGVRPHAKETVNGSQTMWYDTAGRMTKRRVGGFDYYYFWGEDHRMVATNTSSGAALAMTRDIDGSLVKKVVGNDDVTTYYIGQHYEVITAPTSGGGGGGGGGGTDPCCNGTLAIGDCPQVVCENELGVSWPFESSLAGSTLDVETRAYFFFRGQRVAMEKSTSTGTELRYLHQDHLGSTSLTTDVNGNMVSETRYRPYGAERWSNGNTGTDFHFNGERAHDGMSGVHEMGVRFFDPHYYTWLTPDTIIPSPTRPQSLNRYAFVEGNPIRFTDPTGHDKDDKTLDIWAEIEKRLPAVGGLATSLLNKMAGAGPQGAILGGMVKILLHQMFFIADANEARDAAGTELEVRMAESMQYGQMFKATTETAVGTTMSIMTGNPWVGAGSGYTMSVFYGNLGEMVGVSTEDTLMRTGTMIGLVTDPYTAENGVNSYDAMRNETWGPAIDGARYMYDTLTSSPSPPVNSAMTKNSPQDSSGTSNNDAGGGMVAPAGNQPVFIQ